MTKGGTASYTHRVRSVSLFHSIHHVLLLMSVMGRGEGGGLWALLQRVKVRG